ncbi:MAG: hypothetical protein CMF49_01745 [Legionellales bacterium]|nr:hypothetical protein [Legionellales bacterium]|tara:strand:+ start:4041 stop:4619 length:579 start_codon:yes stop_codon:yes gene_type:complete
MSKDYAKKPKKAHKQQNIERPSILMWVIAVALIALFVVSLVYLNHVKPQKKGHKVPAPVHQGHEISPENKIKFEFYTNLPKNNENTSKKQTSIMAPVVDLTHKQSPTPPPPATQTHVYLLQVASFKHYKDADDTKAKLLLAGFNAHVEKAKINQTDWYRVFIGPYNSLQAVEKIQQKLNLQHIKALLIDVKK